MAGHSVLALEAAVDFYVHNIIPECHIDSRTVNPIDCAEWERFFKDKIYPHSRGYTVGIKDKKNILKLCFDKTMAAELSQDVPDLLKKSVQNHLVSKCYCFEITTDLKRTLEIAVDLIKEQRKKV